MLDEDSSIQSYTDEAAEILTRISALFACRELDDEAKDSFFRSLMEAYLNSKKTAAQIVLLKNASDGQKDNSLSLL